MTRSCAGIRANCSWRSGAVQGQDAQVRREFSGLGHPVENQRSRADDEHGPGAPRCRFERVEERQHLQRFAQAHFVGQDAAESVGAQKMQPGHALLLIRPQDGFQVARAAAVEVSPRRVAGRRAPPSWRAPAPASRACWRSVASRKPAWALSQAIAPSCCARRAIDQHLLQFLDRARVQQREFAVLQPRVALAGDAAGAGCRPPASGSPLEVL